RPRLDGSPCPGAALAAGRRGPGQSRSATPRRRPPGAVGGHCLHPVGPWRRAAGLQPRPRHHARDPHCPCRADTCRGEGCETMTEGTSAKASPVARAFAALAIFAAFTVVLCWLAPSDLYLWAKAIHVVAVIAWMAGMLYLPRLFVYHSEVPIGSPQS